MLGNLSKKRSKLLKRDDVSDLRTENKLDPRQRLCWNNYVDQTSPTFSNGYRSALAAGFSESYSHMIREQEWFKDRMRRTHLLGKAEKVMNKILDLKSEDAQGQVKADILRVQSDTAKHITKTLGKDEGYSERTENVGGGGNIVFLPQELINKFNLGKPEEVKPE